MRTTLTKTTTGYLVIVSLMACPLVSGALPLTGAPVSLAALTPDPVLHNQARPVNAEKYPALANNTVKKPEEGITASAPKAKEKKTAEKKTISRCWKRLMNMAREIRHAHGKTQK